MSPLMPAVVNRSLIDGVDDVVSIGSELVRGVHRRPPCKRRQRPASFRPARLQRTGSGASDPSAMRGVKALNGQDAVHTVAAEEDRRIAALVGGNQDLRSLLIVDGQEYEISTGLLALGNLRGQVRLVISGKCLSGNDLEVLGSSLGLELLVKYRKNRHRRSHR